MFAITIHLEQVVREATAKQASASFLTNVGSVPALSKAVQREVQTA